MPEVFGLLFETWVDLGIFSVVWIYKSCHNQWSECHAQNWWINIYCLKHS